MEITVRTMNMTRSEIVNAAHESERRVYQWLRNYLPEISRAKYRGACDMAYRDKQIEVKVAKLRTDHTWQFSLQRHNVLSETDVDFYILRLEDVPFAKAAIHLVVPAPLGTPTLKITFRTLMAKWGQYWNRIDLIEPSITESLYKRLKQEQEETLS